MRIIVNPHKIEIIKDEAVNEKEIDISRCYFEFDDEITDSYVKEAYFTLKGNTYKQIIQNNECDFPSEVLEEKGDIELGVVAFLVENEEEIKRYNPSPAYFDTWKGSLKEAENSEPITPSDKEQIEQQLLNISTQMDNIDIEASKEEHTTTITITRKDGTSYDVEVLDGEKGDKGDKGDPGAVHMIAVQTLPTHDIDESAIYLVPLENPTEEGNNYAEYVYINNQWELLGKIGVHVDLTDYVKNNDYATSSTGGVFKTNDNLGTNVRVDGMLQSTVRNYATYTNDVNYIFISKGTLENVITGKGLVSNTDYASSSTGGVVKVQDTLGLGIGSTGNLFATTKSYSTYQTLADGLVISKGTLENVITGKGLVSNTNYASDSTGGVFKQGNAIAVSNTGTIYVQGKTYEQYLSSGGNNAISKTTLENVLTARIGDINSVLDAINGEVI